MFCQTSDNNIIYSGIHASQTVVNVLSYGIKQQYSLIILSQRWASLWISCPSAIMYNREPHYYQLPVIPIVPRPHSEYCVLWYLTEYDLETCPPNASKCVGGKKAIYEPQIVSLIANLVTSCLGKESETALGDDERIMGQHWERHRSQSTNVSRLTLQKEKLS